VHRRPLAQADDAFIRQQPHKQPMPSAYVRLNIANENRFDAGNFHQSVLLSESKISVKRALIEPDNQATIA